MYWRNSFVKKSIEPVEWESRRPSHIERESPGYSYSAASAVAAGTTLDVEPAGEQSVGYTSAWESSMVTSRPPLPSLPEIGHPESYYARLAHDAQKRGDTHAYEAAKVGQYVTLALDPRLLWEDKLRYFRHALNRHCVPPRIPDDSIWTFYKELQKLVRDFAGREALRMASTEDDLYAAYAAMGQERAKIEERAETLFGRLIPSDQCPDWFHEEDWQQLKLIRDQWI